MELEDLTEKLKKYPRGTVIDLSWDRGNGKLSAYYFYFGISSKGLPVLKHYEKGWFPQT